MTTKSNYTTRNICFVLWLFDNKKSYGHLLEKSFLKDLKHHHEKDQDNLTNEVTINKKGKFQESNKVWITLS